MSKIDWVIRHNMNPITSRVLSFNFSNGREKYLDSYPGNRLVLTINNSDNFAEQMTFNTIVTLSIDGVSDFFFDFWVQEVTFNEYPGNTGMDVATVVAVDWIGRAGRISELEKVKAQDTTFAQLQEWIFPLGPMFGFSVTGYAGSGSNPYSIAAGNTYTGTAANYLNYLVETERGIINVYKRDLQFYARSYIGTFEPISTSYGPTASSSQIAFQQFSRIQNGLQYINRATINSLDNAVASQVSENTASIVSYGEANYQATTLDYSAAQAKGNADWVANSFTEPTALRYTATVVDVAQDSTALMNWLTDSFKTFNPVATLNYVAPGNVSKSVTVIREGYKMSATPEMTRIELTFSPLVYYQYFTLDSDVLGILGGGPFTYNDLIEYDEPTFIYDETYADNSGRLGW